MSFHPRRILPPGASKKRREGEAFYNHTPIPNKRATTNPNPNPNLNPKPNPNPNPSESHSFVEQLLADFTSAPAQAKGKKSPDDPAIDNRLLAGYLAHEFLTRGTVLGQRFDPAQAEAVAMAIEPRRKPGVAEPSQSHQMKGKEKEEEEEAKQHPSYADVSSMLKTEGAHIPGVVNPSQLVKWLHQ